MDLTACSKWLEYSQEMDAKVMCMDTEEAPWYVFNADVKRHARLNPISRLLSKID